MTLCLAIRHPKHVRIYADARVTAAEELCEPMGKVFGAHGVAWAASGDVAGRHLLQHADVAPYTVDQDFTTWFTKHLRPELAEDHKDNAAAIAVTPGLDIYTVDPDGAVCRVQSPYVAIGSGKRHAYAVLDYLSPKAVNYEKLFKSVAGRVLNVGPLTTIATVSAGALKIDEAP